MDGVVRGLSEKLVTFLETGTVADGLFRPDVFLDLTMPTWRVQATGAEELIAERKQGHPATGTVSRWRTDPTPSSPSTAPGTGTRPGRPSTPPPSPCSARNR